MEKGRERTGEREERRERDNRNKERKKINSYR